MEQSLDPCARLSGKRILVTGGTTGIGRATVELLAQAGTRVMTFGRDEQALRDSLRNAGLGDADGLSADDTDPRALAAVFEAVDTLLGGLGGLVTCAALGAQPIHEMGETGMSHGSCMSENRELLPHGAGPARLGTNWAVRQAAEGLPAISTSLPMDAFWRLRTMVAGPLGSLASTRPAVRSSGGRSPRHFTFLKNSAVVANEIDGVVSALDLGPHGRLFDVVCSIAVPGACFILPCAKSASTAPP